MDSYLPLAPGAGEPSFEDWSGGEAGKMWVGACSKKPGNNEKQTWKKEPPLVLTKESGRVMEDGREGDAQPSLPQNPQRARGGMLQKLSCWAGRRRN